MPSRRRILESGLSLAGGTLMAGLLPLARTAWSNAAAAPGGYKALVCVMLRGGNDAFNTVLPWDTDQYGQYRSLRSSLALPRSAAHRLPMDADGRTFCLHPSLPDVARLYRQGELALIYDVGTLAEPIADKYQFSRATVRKPVGLYSHSDQQEQWQSALVESRFGYSGWLGRLTDSMGGGAGLLPGSIAVDGLNLAQTGLNSRPLSVSSALADGLQAFPGYEEPAREYAGTFDGTSLRSLLDRLMDVEHEHPMRREYAQRLRNTVDIQVALARALDLAPASTARFAGDRLSAALRQVARMISVRGELGASRQTFFVNLGGFDTHDDLLARQSLLLQYVNAALKSFRDELHALGVFQQVTTFTMSEFGRTLSSNGRGSDHGWTGHQMVMGSGVKGARSFGSYPTLSVSSDKDVGRGVYIPTMATDVFFADLAMWLGVPAAELPTVLPGLSNFWSATSADRPLGLFDEYG